MNTPVALLIFNRPQTTRRVFEEIRKAKPPLLLIVADGPRADRPGEGDACAAARAIAEKVDWKCEIRTNYSDVNLGCRTRVSTGIDWIFREVEEAIILEDDCLPDPSFFPFCEELLSKYRADERIGHIGGVNFQFGNKRGNYSYYFSRYNHIWGWASWRRAWNGYDADMKLWPEARREKILGHLLGNENLVNYWDYIFDKVYRKTIDTWDYQWTFHCWTESRLAILPNVNLISNIGFNAGATHTTGQSRFDNMERASITFPLSHPPYIVRDAEADRYTEVHHHLINFNRVSAINRIKRLIRAV